MPKFWSGHAVRFELWLMERTLSRRISGVEDDDFWGVSQEEKVGFNYRFQLPKQYILN